MQPSSILPVDFNNMSLKGIPTYLLVEECAYREGCKDRGNSESKVLPNPFPRDFDDIWKDSYKRGKNSRTEPKTHTNVPCDAPNPDQTWDPFIDPYTQGPEHPNGSIDPERTRLCCNWALEGMERSINVVNSRQIGSVNMCIDVGQPILDALSDFPDLLTKYNRLKREGEEALEGSISGQFRWYQLTLNSSHEVLLWLKNVLVVAMSDGVRCNVLS